MYSGPEQTEDSAALQSVLPGVLPEEMLLSRYAVNDQQSFLSVIRKEAAQKVLDDFDLSVVSILVGPCVALSSVDLFRRTEEDLLCGNHTFRFRNGMPLDVAYGTAGVRREYKIDRKTIPGENIVSFSAALQGLAHTSAIPGEVAEFTDRRRDFVRMKRYGAFIRLWVIAALLILSVNFFLFTHFRDLREQLMSHPSITAATALELDALENKVKANREFFAAAGYNGQMDFAWIADQLALQLPEDILLTKMNMVPAETFNRDDTLGFRLQGMQLTGTCAESTSLNEWMHVLEESSWVSSATITDYKDAGNAQGIFQLELIIH
jgi:hypothetical protein